MRFTPFPGLVLLATDGSASAEGAVAIAARLVQRRQAPLSVVTVVDPALTHVVAGHIGLGEHDRSSEEDHRDVQRRAVRRQLARFAALPDSLDIHAESGAPPTVIAQAVEARHAALVLLGLRAHSLLDRVFRYETTLGVMRRASVPVFAVTPLLTELPRRAVIGVDFSLSSLHAARATLPLLADDATLYLAHVERRLRDRDGGDGDGDGPLLSAALSDGFARFRELLHASPRLRMEQVVLDGENFEELDHFAGRVGAQLVALGSIRRDAPQPRGGRVREAFVHAGGISVLVGPPVARASIMED